MSQAPAQSAPPIYLPAQAPARAPRELRVYLSALVVFIASAAATLYFCRTMGGGMEMPGGWTMSMMWMPMPHQSWIAAAAMFLGMWLAMMVAMMLPSALPMLLMYRRVLTFRGSPRAIDIPLMACGYFLVWLGLGAAAYGAGVLVSWGAMRSPTLSRAIPVTSGAALALCGLYQLTRWKVACLRQCRDPLALIAGHLDRRGPSPWRLGIHHGLFCAGCCWALMLTQLVLGMMNLVVMVIVASVIATEKLLPRWHLVSRAVGMAAIAAGVVLFARSL